jgi:hypothetical protein
MAFSFGKTAASASKKPPQTAPGPDPSTVEDEAPAPQKMQQKAAHTVGWLKKGVAAKQMLANEEAKAEQRKEEAGKMWRFWMPPGESRTITFLDGSLDNEGMLDLDLFYEHQIKIGGEWQNFVCVADDDQTCPICERGDSKPVLVGLMTIIDHTPHKVKQGPNAGKIIKNTRKLFACKRSTIKMLSKYAVKRGGLAGCTFDVSRTDDKKPGVGDVFDFTSKKTLKEIMTEYDLKPEDVKPAVYAEEITVRSAEELIELGVGKKPSGPGYEKGVGKSNLKDEL